MHPLSDHLNPLERELLAAAQGPLQERDGVLRQDFVLPPECLCFAGHFPQRPLLPAFVQLMLGRLVAIQGSFATEFQVVERAKFSAPAGPGPLTVTCSPGKQGLRVSLETPHGLISAFILVPNGQDAP
jgi:3-hydroxymyristoyl/3-hydroxydecanoyl-(acyl carrier protein) dehydratase